VDRAPELAAAAVSFWSGAAPEAAPTDELWDRLAAGCLRLRLHAAARARRLAFEPEPGMFIDTLDRYAELSRRVDHPLFGLTIDVGHLHCLGEVPIADQLRKWRHLLWNVHIEDMRRGAHDYIEKPWDNARLLLTLRRQIEMGRALRASRQTFGTVKSRALRARRGLDVGRIGGNGPTRIGKARSGDVAAVMCGAAGVQRLSIEADDLLDIATFLPAPGQGALAIEVREDDEPTRALVAALEDFPTRAAVTAERTSEPAPATEAPAEAAKRERSSGISAVRLSMAIASRNPVKPPCFEAMRNSKPRLMVVNCTNWVKAVTT